MTQPVVVLTGPTACGKSSLAMALARELPVEIVSVDSAQVYRGMDIGTAKPPAADRAAVRHHLIDIREPSAVYSAADFREDAVRAIADIQARDRVPLLVGGTMLYLKALRDGIAGMPSADESIRARLCSEAAEQGWAALHRRLESVDPVAAARIRPSDTQRLQRALEVFELTGRTITAWHREATATGFAGTLVEIAIVPGDRAALHDRIAQRFRDMVDGGLVAEVAALRARGDLVESLPSMKAVGYRQVWQHLDGAFGHDDMIDRGIAATRQLAKRQYTWLRSFRDLHVIDQPNTVKALKILQGTSILRRFR